MKKKRTVQRTAAAAAYRRRLRVEPLEDRRLLATITVDTLIDLNLSDGLWSLREAITLSAAGDTINFAPALTASGPATIQLNNTGHAGEILINKNLTITGPGAHLLTIRAFDLDATAGNGARIFNIDDSTATVRTVNISGLTLTGGDIGAAAGGAIFNAESLTLASSTVTGNTARVGGGVYGKGVTTINQSTIRGNLASYGAGLFHFQGTLNVNNSTISGNSSLHSNGGGIQVQQATLNVSHSTISGNLSGTGGGIASYVSTTTINHSTIAFNYASVSGGGVHVSGGGSTTLNHTIVAMNTLPSNVRSDIAGPVTASHSLIGDNTGATITNVVGNQIGTSAVPIDPLLEVLANNGGPTWTHALKAGSPAIDLGNASIVAPPANDQRGAPFVRIANGDGVGGARIDIGAYERQTVAGLSLVVNTLVDESDGNYAAGDFSLREAIGLANGSIGANTITFAAALTSGGPAQIQLFHDELVASDAVSINGPGSNLLTINGRTASRILNIPAVNAGNFAISGLTLTGGRTTGDEAEDGGGAIRSTSNLAITNSVITGNSATGFFAHGGAIQTLFGNLSITDSTISNNFTLGGFADGGAISSLGPMTLVGSIVSNNSTNGGSARGGGIITGSDLAVTNSIISGNITYGTGGKGGGIFSRSENSTFTNSTISYNTTYGSDAEGAGIYAYFESTFTGCTISGNTALQAPGGGIFGQNRLVTLINTTVSGNTTSGSQNHGGGIYSINELTILNSTITANVAGGSLSLGGGVYTAFDHLTVRNSVIAGNTASSSPDVRDGVGGTTTVNYSLIGNTSGSGITAGTGVGNILNVNAMLGSLANNGGPTMTHLPQASSQAIDNGDPNYSGPLTTDQRGVPFVRVYNDGVNSARLDMGAVERQTQPLPASYFGDYNRNGVVDAADYVLWRKTLTNTVPSYSGADGNGNGIVSSEDYTIWRSNFGRTGPAFGGGSGEEQSGGAAGVARPESATGVVMLAPLDNPSAPGHGSAVAGSTRLSLPKSAAGSAAFPTTRTTAFPVAARLYDDALLAWIESQAEDDNSEQASNSAALPESTADEATDHAIESLELAWSM